MTALNWPTSWTGSVRRPCPVVRMTDRTELARTDLTVDPFGTCPPRQCGIATFARDLEHAIQAADPSVRIRWAAHQRSDLAPRVWTVRCDGGFVRVMSRAIDG